MILGFFCLFVEVCVFCFDDSGNLPFGEYEGRAVGEVGVVGSTVTDVVLSPEVERQEGVTN
jgi:hypothetical protein